MQPLQKLKKLFLWYMVSTKLALKLSFSYFFLFIENVQSSFLLPEKSIANPVVSSTIMLQENHLKKKKNIRKVKDTTNSQASEAISMVHGKYNTSISIFFFLFLLVEIDHLSLLFFFFFYIEDVQTSFFPPEMFIAYLMINSTRMFQESTSMSHLNQVHSITLNFLCQRGRSFNMCFCFFFYPNIVLSFLGPY